MQHLELQRSASTNKMETEYLAVRKSIMRTILYFDIFNHALTAAEICQLVDVRDIDREMIHEQLMHLSLEGTLYVRRGYYCLPEKSFAIEKREVSSFMVERYLEIAESYSRLIASFPFVKGICLSGSLSKGSVGNDADIDYFIITSPNRLWLTKFFLMIYKKLFLFNSKKYFCINYFVDSSNLSIPDKNIFTATELAFIIPTYNIDLYNDILRQNSWIKEHYPNKPSHNGAHVQAPSYSKLKHFFESLFGGAIGNVLENLAFSIFKIHRSWKYRKHNKRLFSLDFRSDKNVSKHHPKGFQHFVLESFSESLRRFETY